MAKACVYLCRQCLFIDGFGEFGYETADLLTYLLRLKILLLTYLLFIVIVDRRGLHACLGG